MNDFFHDTVPLGNRASQLQPTAESPIFSPGSQFSPARNVNKICWD